MLKHTRVNFELLTDIDIVMFIKVYAAILVNVLASTREPITNICSHTIRFLKKKHPHLAKKKVLFHQDNSHMPGTDGQIPLRIASPSSIFARFRPMTISCFQTWRNDSEERNSPPESSSSPKQRFILKSWANHIIRTAWKSWKIVRSSWKNRAERRLRWEIKMNRSKKMYFTMFF